MTVGCGHWLNTKAAKEIASLPCIRLRYYSLTERALMRVRASSIVATVSAVALAVVFVACRSGTSTASASPSASYDSSKHGGATLLVPSIAHSGAAVVCELNGRTSAPSYSASDVGKQGVPKLSRRESKMLRRIEEYVHSATLRFAFVNGSFVVYDAVAGPCSPQAPGYFDLAGGCNEYYTPPLDVSATHAEPGCLFPPRPWIAHDRGLGKWSWHNYAQEMQRGSSGSQ